MIRNCNGTLPFPEFRVVMFYSIIKKALFKIDPETAHEMLLKYLKRISGSPIKRLFVRAPLNARKVICMYTTFTNPLGLAAGLDKNGEFIDLLGSIGFGAIEVGTVTPRAQFGNNKPRLFRIVKANGLINRMGFNNHGVDNLINNIKNSNFRGVLGINIGKNKDTPLDHGEDDYLICMEKVYSYAGYIAINISSPNTPGLRKMQFGERLDGLLQAIKNKQRELQLRHNKYVPVALKISPDMTNHELIKVADSLVRYKIDGIIATNTTTARELVFGLENCSQYGGLSGRPLQSRSTEVIRLLSKELAGKLPIIGVGGVDSIVAAREKIAAGATLIQLYSGLIYHGPSVIQDIIRNI